MKLRSNGTISVKLYMIITQPFMPNQIPMPMDSNSTLHILVTRTVEKNKQTKTEKASVKYFLNKSRNE